MSITIATGKNLKRISKVISNGQVIDGTIHEYMEDKLGRTRRTDSVPETASKVKEDEKKKELQVKQCLGCSSPAVEGKDYCSSCLVFIK